MQSRRPRLLVAVASLLLLSSSRSVAQSPTPTCPAHARAEDYVAFTGLSVMPTQPAVGDSVVLTFSVQATTTCDIEVPRFMLAGTQPSFDGDTSHYEGGQILSSAVQYHLRAAQAGSAALQLGVTFESCVPRDITSCFFYSAVSQTFMVEIAAASTPTPTPTATGTATSTPTPAVAGGGGCAIAPVRRNDDRGAVVLLLVMFPWGWQLTSDCTESIGDINKSRSR
jgi:hypothetical protein